MSITLEQFKEQMKPSLTEIENLNERRRKLHDEFVKLANIIEVAEEEEDKFRDLMFDYAANFIDNIDYEYSEVDPGSVNIWQASTC